MLLVRTVLKQSLVQNLFSIMSVKFSTIGTHNGTFHCDEVLGCFLLKVLNKDAEIIRSRDPAVLDKCDIVIDVGGVYDFKKLRFDHHQRGFDHTMKSLRPEMPFDIKLSSAGLVYCHFGEAIIEKMLGSIEKESLSYIYKKLYSDFLIEIDGIDNGIEMFNETPKYTIKTNLSSRVGHLNKRWNDDNFNENSAFNEAMTLAGNEFRETVNYIYKSWLPAKREVINAMENRFKVHDSGEIIQLDQYVPFIEHLHTLEEEMSVEPKIKYVLYEDGKNWRVRAVPISPSSFILRLGLLEKWRGLRDKDLEESGLSEGAIFVHASGFIGGHKTKQGALEMAVKSLISKN